MRRSRVLALEIGATSILLITLLLPALVPSATAGPPPLTPSARAALSTAAGDHALLPWQRHLMQSLARGTATPAGASRTTGTDGVWAQMPPPPLEEASAVYDPVRQSMLVFGGQNGLRKATNDVWELTLSGTPAWTLLATNGTPPSPRSGHCQVFDRVRERLLVFGGADQMTYNDCWELDLTQSPPAWGQGSPAGTPPSRRLYASAVFDSLNDRALVFGGADSLITDGPPLGFRNDVWALSFTGPLTWTQLSPAGVVPSVRAGGTVIYDRARQRLVLFGGYDGTMLADAFTLSLGLTPTWAPLSATGGPPPARAVAAVVYEAPQDRMVMFGGVASDQGSASLNDVWTLDLAAPAWTQLSPGGTAPSPRQFSCAVYDTPRDRMVIFGGSGDTGPVPDPLWALSLGASPAWTEIGGARPPERLYHAGAFDPTRNALWVHGGMGSNMIMRGDLWKLSLDSPMTWSHPTTSGTPLGKRLGHSAIYDPVRDRLVFFGGNDSTLIHNDVWSLALAGTPAWSQLVPTGTPPDARYYHSAVYDAVNDRMIVYGGQTGSSSLNDVWALSLAATPAWSQLAPSGLAPSLWMQSAAMDLSANRMIIFGGESGGNQNRVYALTLSGSPAWAELTPTGTPPVGRRGASMVTLGTRMLVFAGDSSMMGGLPLDDSWLLTLYPSPSWRPLDVGPRLPGGRQGHVGIFDPATFRYVAFGGGWDANNETWVLQLDELVPALAALVSARSAPDRVELVWEVSRPVTATVYRRAPAGDWVAVGTGATDGDGRVSFVDRDVVAGARYGYRLGMQADGAEVFAGEVWVDVPGGVRLALRGMTPNPAPAGGALISFSLPDASPARLEVLDVGGRRVLSREVGNLGPGEHILRVSDVGALPVGIYLVRLTHGAQVLTAKAVTLR